MGGGEKREEEGEGDEKKEGEGEGGAREFCVYTLQQGCALVMALVRSSEVKFWEWFCPSTFGSID